MKKKLLLYLLVVVALFTVTACGGSKEDKDEKVTDNTITVVNGIELHIDKEKEFKGIKYTITDYLFENVQDYYVEYKKYQDSGPNLLFFRIFYYENKDHNYIRNDLAIDNNLEEVKGKTDNVEYTFIDLKRTDGTIHFYIIEKDNISYVVNFVSQYDIKDFEKIVLNSIKF